MNERTSLCETKLGGEIRCSFIWNIEAFKNFKEKNGEKISSDGFFFWLPDGQATNWQLDLYPRGQSQRDEGDISVFLTSNNDHDVRVHFSLSALDPSGNKIGTKVVNEYTFSKTPSPAKLSYGFAPLIRSSEIQGLNEQDTLTIVCEMIVYCPEVIAYDKQKQEDCDADLCDDFSQLFSEAEHSDVEIICGEETFACHKSILAARSPVFEAMFQVDMEEKKDNKVEIKDFSPEVIENMLQFIYCAKMPCKEDSRDQISELLKAADQYDVNLLKVACDEILCISLSVENCLVSLIIADMYQAEKLKKHSMKMLVENMRTVVTKNSEDWKKCLKSHPDLTIEITEELSKTL